MNCNAYIFQNFSFLEYAFPHFWGDTTMSLFARKKLRNKQKGNPDHPQTTKSVHFEITYLEIHYYMVKRIKSAKPWKILYPVNWPTGKTTVNHHVPHLLQTQIVFLPFGRNYISEGKTNLCWRFFCLSDTFIAKSVFSTIDWKMPISLEKCTLHTQACI